MRLLSTFALFMGLAAIGSKALAQWAYPAYQPKAATAGESHARGAADLVRSAGEANLLNSEAAINLETARSANLDNRLKYAETFYSKRQQRQYYEESTRKPRVSDEYMFRMNQRLQPKRLASTELDPVSGKLHWPLALQRDEFAASRKAIDAIFADKGSQSHIDRKTMEQITKLGTGMQKQLSSMIKDVPPQDYLDAKKFLASLLYEARVMAT